MARKYVDVEHAKDILYGSLKGYRHTSEKSAVKNCIVLINEMPTFDMDIAIKAMEKQISKKPVFDKDGCLVCSNCGSYEGVGTETDFIEGYCWECGQKIDTDFTTEKGGEG